MVGAHGLQVAGSRRYRKAGQSDDEPNFRKGCEAVLRRHLAPEIRYVVPAHERTENGDFRSQASSRAEYGNARGEDPAEPGRARIASKAKRVLFIIPTILRPSAR